MASFSKNIGKIVLFFLFSTLIMTICSQNSFLYPFNTEPDVSCFYTTGKSILHGKVLYRDIYEHKGLYLYFLYMLAYLVDNNGYLGVYLLEIISSTIFMYFSYKSLLVLSCEERAGEKIAIISGVCICICGSFQEGGFAEEFFIPIISIIVYLTISYFNCIYPKDIPFLYVFVIGMLSASLFWAKYTSLGLVLGLVLYLIWLYIVEKKVIRLLICVAEFLVGFFVGSIPLIAYFSINNAWKDLFEVYFYNLLFVYGKYNSDKSGIAMCIDRLLKGNGAEILLVESAVVVTFFFLFYIVKAGFAKKHVNQSISAMFWGSILILAYGILYKNCYQVLVMFPFYPIALFMIYDRIEHGNIEKNCEKWNEIDQFVKKNSSVILTCLGGVPILLYLIKVYSPVMFVFLCLLYARIIYKGVGMLERYLSRKTSASGIGLVKYICLLLVYIIYVYVDLYFSLFGTYRYILTDHSQLGNAFLCALMLVLFAFASTDLSRNRSAVSKSIMSVKDRFCIAITQKKHYGFLCIVVLLISLLGGNSISYALWSLEDTPQYKIMTYIQDKGINNPSVICYTSCDTGVYTLLEVDPQVKYFGWYNIEFDELMETRASYIENEEVDYVIVTNSEKIDSNLLSHYRLIMSVPQYQGNGTSYIMSLFERKSLSE